MQSSSAASPAKKKLMFAVIHLKKKKWGRVFVKQHTSENTNRQLAGLCWKQPKMEGKEGGGVVFILHSKDWTKTWTRIAFQRSYILAPPLHQSKSSVSCLKAGNQFFLKCSEGSCRSLPSNPGLHERLQFITGCYKIEIYKCSKWWRMLFVLYILLMVDK